MDNIQNIVAEPVKFFEAIITKTPMIVSKEMNISEMVCDKNIGYKVDGSSIEDIRSLVQTISSNRDTLAKKVENLEQLQDDYSWESIVKNLNQIFET
jgi:glycosyltransferase involved in cell wall biosynthesis